MEHKLEAEKVIAPSAGGEEEQLVHSIEHELECPRCHDSMELCSDFDNLYYLCKECDFCLYTIKRNK
ncbi:MAG TPA: hypothetical protein VF172_10255 [Nitrososphaera sp.]